MRIKNIIQAVFFSLALISWYSCRPKNEANELAHDHHHEHSHEHDGDEDEEEEDAIVILPERAKKLGIEVSEIRAEPFREAIKVGGQITAPPSSRRSIVAKTSGIINLRQDLRIGSYVKSGEQLGYISTGNVVGSDAIKSLQVEYESTKAEMERLLPLYEQGIVSAKDFNTAKTSFEKAKAAKGNITVESGASISAPLTGTLITLAVNNGEFVEAGKTIGYVGDNATLTLRADLPKRYHTKWQQIDDAFIIPGCGDCEGFLISQFNGKKLDGNVSTNDNISGFLPVYFSFTNNGTIDGNGYVSAYLQLNESKTVISVPDESLIEQQGEWFVFVKLDEDCYEKRPVRTGGVNGQRTEIIEGLEAGENVVVKGTAFVKLAESSGAVPEGHSHNN